MKMSKPLLLLNGTFIVLLLINIIWAFFNTDNLNIHSLLMIVLVMILYSIQSVYHYRNKNHKNMIYGLTLVMVCLILLIPIFFRFI
ncbi:hypothetical protein SAMN05421734_104201 [Pelagirhabdus alkalitolerans]|uniref:Uncharacterized protein n=1 Tax=Pelagirhabdus alkalitolerans TaxID=1612202 RepID=A0A1G6J1Z1_9BACI|nr:hypothetical protein SAMN05421734_104201 [Pelagirhabdus alkalitolerans]